MIDIWLNERNNQRGLGWLAKEEKVGGEGSLDGGKARQKIDRAHEQKTADKPKHI
jgi:hypothetical protein